MMTFFPELEPVTDPDDDDVLPELVSSNENDDDDNDIKHTVMLRRALDGATRRLIFLHGATRILFRSVSVSVSVLLNGSNLLHQHSHAHIGTVRTHMVVFSCFSN